MSMDRNEFVTRLLQAARKLEGHANKELAKFTGMINALADKMER